MKMKLKLKVKVEDKLKLMVGACSVGGGGLCKKVKEEGGVYRKLQLQYTTLQRSLLILSMYMSICHFISHLYLSVYLTCPPYIPLISYLYLTVTRYCTHTPKLPVFPSAVYRVLSG